MAFGVLFLSIVSFIPEPKALTYGRITGSGVSFRSGATTDASIYTYLNKGYHVTLNSTNLTKGKGCTKGWYSANYNGKSGYVCGDYVEEVKDTDIKYSYNRPWTSPKKAIIGGAEFIADGYINAGQNTSYLKKYNVNPNADSPQNSHQYMANLAAPFSEAKSTYNSYKDNGLLSLPLHFTIPIFDNMPSTNPHPVYGEEKGGLTTVKDKNFEKLLNNEKFPESYKKWLRAIHEKYPNWTFESLQTNLDFKTTVSKQQLVGSIQKSSCPKCVHPDNINTEGNWYIATEETVAYFLDPRNFLEEDSILMFEDLSYNEVYKEEVVKSVLKGTFMEGKDNVDNQTYSSMFMEAGKSANVNPVYLAALSRQEMGSTKGIASSGQRFDYKGITYEGFYNFYNIGAYSSEENPAKAGVVYAAAGGKRNNDGVYVGNIGGEASIPVTKPDTSNNQNTTNNNNKPNSQEKPPTNNNSQGSNNSQNNTKPEENITPVSTHLSNLNLNKKGKYLTNVSIGITAGALKDKTKSKEITLKKSNGNNLGDSEKVTTGTIIKFASGEEYTLIVYGDLNGDGAISLYDLQMLKMYLLGKQDLSEASLEASKVYKKDSNKPTLADLQKIKLTLLNKDNIAQS